MRTLLPAFIALLLTTQVFAQRRSELIEQVSSLNSKNDSLQSELITTQRALKTAETKVTTIESQNEQLKQTNQDLLTNLNKFIQASTEKTSYIGETLESMQKTEAQLKAMTDSFSAHDSISYMVLTDLKRTLGENAQIGVENGAVLVILNNTTTFGSSNNKIELSAGGKDFINRLSETIAKHDTLAVTIESLGNKSWSNVANKAAVIADHLVNEGQIEAGRIDAVGKAAEADVTYIKLHPKFDKYYLWLRELVKNGR
ncbi:hypothetical protein E7Z59_07810 [Robertkochia marina]|uniref:OmpA-like domain-containing protein n=1 Tax=Robertkochia marina TaxID=1227945 RepID=A0A4S3M068_9FLAO|nr:hypothetical protein [Robertkochia marina]THD67558.1 hypothetical protein E7Z59_07810 [Robertkochia marina]